MLTLSIGGYDNNNDNGCGRVAMYHTRVCLGALAPSIRGSSAARTNG
jgi:hypothetical protein